LPVPTGCCGGDRDRHTFDIGFEHRAQLAPELLQRELHERCVFGEIKVGFVARDLAFPLLPRECPASALWIALDGLNGFVALMAHP
jgi:hypothetical protein